MMGQQQTVVGSALRRILLVLTVTVVMAAMAMAMASPAFARGGQPYGGSCVEGTGNAYNNIGLGDWGNAKAPYRDKGDGQEHGMNTAEAETADSPHCK